MSRFGKTLLGFVFGGALLGLGLNGLLGEPLTHSLAFISGGIIMLCLVVLFHIFKGR